MEQEPNKGEEGIENLPPRVQIAREFTEIRQHGLELGAGNISPDALKRAQEILFML